jgi:predicted transposase/invertase (TIGR01784 family)
VDTVAHSASGQHWPFPLILLHIDMITDPLFYRLFETSPETFFLLLGMPADVATEMATRYQYLAIEFKETAHRTDGVFLPREPDLPLYFLDVQFYPKPTIYADLLVKAYTYLKQNDPAQDFRGVVLFASRSFEPPTASPYRPLLDAGLIRRFYLEELPELANAPLGLSVLFLIRRPESEAPGVARELVARVKREIKDEAIREDLIELIETVIIYRLPRLSRKEIRAMIQFHDFRQTRVYQEGVEDGEKKTTTRHIMRLATEKKMPPEEIAATLEVDLDFVCQVLKEGTNGSP